MRILVVEDDKKIASFVVKGLAQAGYAVDHAADGEKGLKRALAVEYDAAIVDIMLPQLDGLSMIARLREKKILMPVIVLSAKRSVDDRVKGLQGGGDDYLTKPFSFVELLARVQALIRRSHHTPESPRLRFGGLPFDLLLRAGERVDLQPRECSLLEYLLRNAGKVVSKAMIIEHVWGYDFDPMTNIVDVLVSRLRNKIDRDFETKLIHTHRGVGYALKSFKAPS